MTHLVEPKQTTETVGEAKAAILESIEQLRAEVRELEEERDRERQEASEKRFNRFLQRFAF